MTLVLAATEGHCTLSLKRVALLPFGLSVYGMLVLTDTDQDSLGEMHYVGRWEAARVPTYEIAEYRPVNRFEVVRVDTGGDPTHIPNRGNFRPYAAVDMDRDGLVEVVGHVLLELPDRASGVCTIEPSTPGGLPDTFNWLFVDTSLVTGGRYRYVTDLDQDSLLEILTMNCQWGGTAIYENVADNRESLVYCRPPYAPHIWGDFDQNGRMDFVVDNYEAEHIFECTGDNQFAEVCSVSSEPWTNQHDWFSGRDVDRNGRPEFFVAYFKYLGSKNYLCMFEAVAEHEYTRYVIDSVVHSGGDWPVSLCADLDSDGFEELVWAIGRVVQVMQPTGPHQFETVFDWTNDHAPDYQSTRCNVADFNRNGYNELYIGGNLKTSILEVEAVRVLYPDTSAEFLPGDTCLIRWQTFTPPRCDSVALFLLTDTVVPGGEWFWNLDTIVTGLAPTESSYAWVVPDTVLEAGWVVAIAYGPGWQFDRSDEPFRIVPAGVEEAGPPAWERWDPPTVLSGVVKVPAGVSADLLDVCGRKVFVLLPGLNDIRRLAPGVYFLRSAVGREPSAVRKVVIQR